MSLLTSNTGGWTTSNGNVGIGNPSITLGNSSNNTNTLVINTSNSVCLSVVDNYNEILTIKNNNIYISRKLPKILENIILSINNFSEKLVLGGSLSLYLLGLINVDFETRDPDIDFALLDKFTQEELTYIINFFQLQSRTQAGYEDTPLNIEKLLHESEILLFQHLIKNEDDTLSTIDYKIDFFHQQILKKRDYIDVLYHVNNEPHLLKLVHPSVVISYKAKYAFDTRIGKQFKHWEDIEELYTRKQSKNYFNIMKKIDKFMDDKRYIERSSPF